MIRAVVAVIAVWVVLGPVAASAQVRGCLPTQQVRYVRDVMADMYYWYREIPALDSAKFDAPEDYLDAARFRPLDSTFSYITSAAANRAFYSESEYVGFGFSTLVTADDSLRVTQVFPDSPAGEAGMRRGDRIVAIDGRVVAELLAGDGVSDALGPVESGVTRQLLLERDGTRVEARLTKRAVTIPTVSLTRVFDVAGRKVGYLFFRNFVEPSTTALDVAFAELRRAGVTELVLDVRYNGGGLVSVAQHLADLIGGRLTAGQVFAEYVHNDRNSFRNETLRFGVAADALTLSRVVLITTRASASASELVANALRPFMPVILVGDRTYGKPVGQYGFTFCTKVLALVSFSLRNADGEADYFDGLAPTCGAADDVDRQLGDPLEGSLREALNFIDSGRCSAAVAASPLRRRPSRRPPGDGWSQLVGAN